MSRPNVDRLVKQWMEANEGGQSDPGMEEKRVQLKTDMHELSVQEQLEYMETVQAHILVMQKYDRLNA